MSNATRFVHLHNHSQYSILDGLSRIPQMVERAAELGQPAIGLTDHGVMYGAVEFYETARAANIKPILGMEGYMALENRAARGEKELSPHHLTLFAANADGYRGLNRLATLAHLEGFYKRPRFDWSDLERHGDGLIVLSGCPSGALMRSLLSGNIKAARQIASKFKTLLGKRYFLEIMRHACIQGQEDANQELIKIGEDLDIPLVATNDSHYVLREEAETHAAMLCIQTNSYLDDPARFKFDSDEFFLRTDAEMAELFSDIPEALQNTLRVAEMVDLELQLGGSLAPRFPVPNGRDSMQYLRELCAAGCEQRFGSDPSQAVKDRLEYELDVIKDTNYADYFLVCWDIFNFVNRERILSAVRGSAAASMVLYCLKVTQLDPLEHALVFERFLNRERKEMPDIDMDFEDERREEVIRYCVDKYGESHVAQIITFGTLGARTALRDVARILKKNSVGDRLARLIPERLNISIDGALAEVSELDALYRDDKTCQQVIDLARSLEGAVRHASTHAAGVVISGEPLTDYIALQRSTSNDADAPPTTQCAMNPLARVGLLKMDFLGLRNLTVVVRTIADLNAKQDAGIDIYKLPLDDRKTFKMLSAGDTFGVFQLESEGMTSSIRKLEPGSIADIAAMIALYRPGPMDHIGEFIEAKHGRRKATYPHENLRHILEETYGVIVYQDQILLIAREFGGYSLGDADVLRKAMGKKIPAVMAAEHDRFLEGAQKNGYQRDLAERMFKLIEPFAGYAFNKAHSVSYAMIAYWTAYLKANYKLDYFANLLDSQSGEQARIAANVESAQRAGIKVLAPSINHSGVGFNVSQDRGSLILGLANIKGVGRGSAEDLISTRGTQKFGSLEDFCGRISASQTGRSTLETLIKAGALDEFGERTAIMNKLDSLVSFVQARTKMRETGQDSMFNLFGEKVATPMPTLELEQAELDRPRYIEWELESLGIALSGKQITTQNGTGGGSMLADIKNMAEGTRRTVHGRISALSRRTDKNGMEYLRCKLVLVDGTLDAVVWSDVLKRTAPIWVEGGQIEVTGSIKYWKDEPNLVVHEVGGATPEMDTNTLVEPVGPRKTLTVKIKETDDYNHDVGVLDGLLSVLLDYRGKDAVTLEVATPDKLVRLILSDKVEIGDDLTARLEETLGSANFIVGEE